MAENLLTVDEAADLLGVSPATVKRQCAAGRLKARKVGRSWVVDANALPKPKGRAPSRRRPSAVSTILDLETALRQLRSQDLRRDVWVPDVLHHADDVAEGRDLIANAAARIDDQSIPFDPPTTVAVPKTPFFPRNATDLSIVDRLAYQAVVSYLAPAIEATLGRSVYSARLQGDGKGSHLLKGGRDSWVRWRNDVRAAIKGNDAWVIEADITAYFDFIKHEVLLPELQALPIDQRVIPPLREMLRAWTSTPNTGLPQGPDASRVLANFYMSSVDSEMSSLRGISYFRYMDDIRIVGERRSDVIHALQVLDSECRRRGLALSTKKTVLRRGRQARAALEDPELDALQYAFDVVAEDSSELRSGLRRVFRKTVSRDEIDRRHAGFSLWRLFQLRDGAVTRRVLDGLEAVATLGWLVPAYLLPWMRRPKVQERITAYLVDKDRNVTPYLSTWLMAAMLDIPNHLADEWVAYARGVSLDRSQPPYHRAVALNVLVLGRSIRDISRVEDIVRREHDPEVVRAAIVALARVKRLTKPIADSAQRIAGLQATLRYLKGRSTLPSLIYSSKENAIR